MSTDASTPDPARALATEHLWDMHTPRYLAVVAVGSLVPAVLLAPLFQWATSPEFAGAAGLGKCYLIAVMPLAVMLAFVVPIYSDMSSGAYLRRTRFRFSLFADRIELRDGHDAVLGDTADGSLRVRAINKWLGRQMVGAVQLVYRGGLITVTPSNSVAPAPGQPAERQLGRWHSVSSGVYAHLLRFAS